MRTLSERNRWDQIRLAKSGLVAKQHGKSPAKPKEIASEARWRAMIRQVEINPAEYTEAGYPTTIQMETRR